MLVLNEYVYDVDDDADLDDDGDGGGGDDDDDDSAVDMLNDHEARVGTYRFKYNLFDSKEHTESCKKYSMTIGSSISHHRIHHYIIVLPSVVVHEPAPHAGLRTDCEYIE